MGGSNGKLFIEKQIEMLKRFRKYERELYTYFFDSSNKIEDIEFYFISTEYIINYCKIFKYSNNSDELDLLITYLEGEPTTENYIISKNLLENIRNRTNMKKDFEPINNTDLIYNSNNPYIIKLKKVLLFL